MTHRDFLFHLERFGIKLGLENISRLLSALGNPHERVLCVHVAGTNGKGSVLAMLDSILRKAGYSTARYTSPHLISLNERFLFNGEPITDEELDYHLEKVRSVAERMDPLPTFFECLTAVNFSWMEGKQVDLALIEVGMGGRFDATNVIKPLVAAITSIGLEHTKYLGDTLEKIAFEKAGIIKPQVPVVVNETAPGPLGVILDRARDLSSPTYVLNRDYHYNLRGDEHFRLFEYHGRDIELGPVKLGLAGAYQGANAAATVALVERLRAQFPRLTPEAVKQGLAHAKWPCRMEKVLDDPPVWIDVAHNAHGAERLAAELDRCVLLLAVSSDKTVAQIIETLGPKAEELILTQFSGTRALPVDELCRAAGDRHYRRAPSIHEALALGMQLASKQRPLVITGSIFLAGEARAILIEKYGATPLRFH